MQNALKFRLAGLVVAFALVWTVPALAFADETDPKDLSNYSDEERHAKNLWIGEDDLTPGKVDIGEVVAGFDDEATGEWKCIDLPSDAYTVDGSWWQNGKAVKIPTRQTEDDTFAIKLKPNKSKGYYGEAFIHFRILDRRYAGNFHFKYADQGTFLFDKGETLEDVSKRMDLVARTKNGKVNLTQGKDYELTWEKAVEGSDDGESYRYESPSKKSDRAVPGYWRVKARGLGKNYGEEALDVHLRENTDISNFSFAFNGKKLGRIDLRNYFVLSEESLSLESLNPKVYSEEQAVDGSEADTPRANLVKNKDYKLVGWYRVDDDGNRNPINGTPNEDGWYEIKISGLGKYEGTEKYVSCYVGDPDKDLDYWSVECPYLSWSMDLSPEKLGVKIHRERKNGKTATLEYGKDYVLKWAIAETKEDENIPYTSYKPIEGTPTDKNKRYNLEVIGQGKYKELDGYIFWSDDDGKDPIIRAEKDCPHRPSDHESATYAWLYSFGGKEATCTETGTEHGYRCKRCGAVVEEPKKTPALGHDYLVVDDAVKASCDKDGSTEARQCSRCGKRTGGEKVAKFGHRWDSGKVTTAATCDKAGTRTYTCSTCKAAKTEPVPATGKHVEGKGAVTTPATCEKDGLRTFKCTTCGKVIRTEAIKATGHKWSTKTEQPTCGKPGKETSTCIACGKVETKEIPATGKHSYDNGKVTKQATCTEYGDWKVVKAAAENVKGSEERTCSVCGNKETRDIAALPASVKAGTTTAVSGATVTVASTAPAKTPSGAKAAGTVTYKRPTNTSASSVTVPTTVKVQGKTYVVTKLDTNAFKNNKKVKTVKLPSTITQVNSQAFSGCTALKSVSLPSVTTIGSSAFKGAKSLTSVSTGKNLRTISASAFSGAKKLKTLTVTSKSLTKRGVKGSLKGSSVKTVKVKVGSKKVNKTYVKKYKKIFTKGNAGKKASVK